MIILLMINNQYFYLSNTLATKVQSNQMMESVSDLERDGNDVRIDNMNEPKDKEEQNDGVDDQDPNEDANEDEDTVENEIDRSNMRSEDENDGDNENGAAKFAYILSL